ncbi:MAG: hypothetical protein ACXVLQ_09950, partial [Bacteriovorax sp.]
GCPNLQCHFHQKKDNIVRDGFYFRKEDSRKIARFKCKYCGKKFSFSTCKLEYRQKKRRVNHKLFLLLASGLSMRRAAKYLNIHRTTVHRKVIYLAKKARQKNNAYLSQLTHDPVMHLQFDDLISSIHTKFKPVSISIAVDAKTRFILGAKVASIPAFGHLAELSRRKYGRRKNEHDQKLTELLQSIAPAIYSSARVESDEHYSYAPIVKKVFPHAEYNQLKSEKSCVAGQGELKKVNYDPLFRINHTCAMFRANVNRLIRRTWCTSKKSEMLQNHLDIYICYHNHYYL